MREIGPDISFDWTLEEPGVGPNDQAVWDDAKDRAQDVHEASEDGIRTLATTSIYRAEQLPSPSAPFMGGSTEYLDIYTPLNQYLDDKPGETPAGNQTETYVGHLRAVGRKELWTYQSCYGHSCDQSIAYATGWPNRTIDAAGIQARAESWMHFIYGATGFLYYEVANWPTKKVDDSVVVTLSSTDSPFDSSPTDSGFSGAGDGWLVYPGSSEYFFTSGNYEAPVASVRLKALRDGLEDYEYLLKCAAKDPAQASSIARQLFPMAASTAPESGSMFNVWDYLSQTDADRLDDLELAREALAECAEQELKAPPYGDAPLSKPLLDEPIYGCTSAVFVSGFVPHSSLRVFVDNTQVAEVEGYEPAGQRIPVPITFVPGQHVTISQVRYLSGGSAAISDSSNEVEVRSAKADYPNGLPAVSFNPGPPHTCAQGVSLADVVQSAHVTLERTAGSDVSWPNSQVNPFVHLQNSVGGYDPLAQGETLKATQEFCRSIPEEHVVSQPTTVVVVQGPSTLDPPTLESIYSDGNAFGIRGIVDGANVEISHDGSVDIAPQSSREMARWIPAQLKAGLPISARQYFCDPHLDKVTKVVTDCREIPPLRVRPYVSGDETIRLVDPSVPGARVVVMDGTSVIGDGGGSRIFIWPSPAAGTELTVYHMTPQCDEAAATVVTVR